MFSQAKSLARQNWMFGHGCPNWYAAQAKKKEQDEN